MEGQHIRAKRKPELVRSENVAENGKRGSKDWGQKVGKFGLRAGYAKCGTKTPKAGFLVHFAPGYRRPANAGF